jgi:hypothetical protein
MYGLVVAGAYVPDLSVGLTYDRAHRLLLLRIVGDFATKDGLNHTRMRLCWKKYDWKLTRDRSSEMCPSFFIMSMGKTTGKRR